MNSNISLSFVASSLEEFRDALAMLQAAGVSSPNVTVAPGAVVPGKGPNEIALNAAGKRIRFSSQMAAKYGTAENYCAALLREMNLPVPSASVENETAENEAGETYEPGEIPEPGDAWGEYSADEE